MPAELIKAIISYGPWAILAAVAIWRLPEVAREWLHHRREMFKIRKIESRKEAKIEAQLEEAKRKRSISARGK